MSIFVYIYILMYIYTLFNSFQSVSQFLWFYNCIPRTKYVRGILWCIPRTKYVRGILWFSRRYAASASASAFHRLRDNFKKPYRIASIFYMQIDIGERIAGKQDWPGSIIYGPPRAPRRAKNTHFCIQWPIYEKLSVIFFPCYAYVCSVMRSYCPEIFIHLGST